MNEKDRIQMDKLEEYVKDYMLFIDTCSLMFDKGIDLFWSHIIPLLKKHNKKILMPYKCWLELKNILQVQIRIQCVAQKKRCMM